MPKVLAFDLAITLWLLLGWPVIICEEPSSLAEASGEDDDGGDWAGGTGGGVPSPTNLTLAILKDGLFRGIKDNAGNQESFVIGRGTVIGWEVLFYGIVAVTDTVLEVVKGNGKTKQR